jgi:formylglycine-generating enzyme required for sulfatase activity
MSAAASELPTIPGYAVEAALGSGGMATVYRGRQLALDRPVAIKVVRAYGRDAAELGQRFEQEAKLIAALDHPNIVAIFEVTHTTDGDACYVMPLFEHGDLASRPRPIPEAEIKRVLRAVLGALGHAHANGVVHRDVKPANVLFDARGTPLLADFGVALKVSSVERLTSHGRAVGSSQSMSPEQARGEAVDGRSDLYSVGCLAWELLIGAPPFGDEDFLVVALRHQQDPVPRLPQSLSHWQPFFDRALAKRPQDRFATAAEMAAALEPIVAHMRPPQTRRGPLLAGAVLAVLLTLALGWWWSRSAPADGPPATGSEVGNAAFAQIATAIEQRRWFDGSASSADALLGSMFATEPVDATALDLRDSLLDLASAELIAADDASLAQRLPIWQRFVLDTRAIELPPVRSVNLALEARWRPALERARVQRDRAEASAELKLGSTLPAPSPEFAELVELVGRFPARGEPFRDGDGPDLLLVPGGRLAGYGAPFAVTRFEITRADYKRFTDATGRNAGSCRDGGRQLTWLNPGFEQAGAEPVVCVSFADAAAYADWLSRESGRSYRLPTLPEWQALSAAARVDACGNLRGENAECQDRYRETSPSGRFAHADDLPGDLVGNVREWTATCEYKKTNILKRTGTFLLNVPRKKENEVANPEQVCVARFVAGSGWRDSGVDRAATSATEDSAAVDRGFRLIREIR